MIPVGAANVGVGDGTGALEGDDPLQRKKAPAGALLWNSHS